MKVQKATTDYGGRMWTACFAPDIQIQEGPYVFSGLPGLFLKINDDFNDYIFDIQEIKQNEEPLHYRKTGLKMIFPTFKKFMMNYYIEPYAEKKVKNEPIFKATDTGEIVRDNYNDATKYLQKIIKENNNPIELNYKNNYKKLIAKKTPKKSFIGRVLLGIIIELVPSKYSKLTN